MDEYAAWFISRQDQAQNFVNTFRRETRALARMAGPGGIDSAWLIQRLRHECSAQDVAYAHLDFSNGHMWDYLAIVRIVRDQMGATHFNLLTRALNKIGTGALPALGEVDHMHRQDLSAAAGRSAATKDDFAFVQARMEKDRRTMEERVTLAFHTCLKAMSENGPQVFILDTYDQASQAARHWLQDNLLNWSCQARPPYLVTLLTGQDQPLVDSGWCRRLMLETTFSVNPDPDYKVLNEYVCLSRP